jgi:hypothetical protein
MEIRPENRFMEPTHRSKPRATLAAQEARTRFTRESDQGRQTADIRGMIGRMATVPFLRHRAPSS